MELEKAKRICKHRINHLKCKYAIINEDLQAIETILQALENSIPTEVIEKKIAELWIKCPKNSINKFMINERNNKIEVLQEILEGK